MRFLLLSVTISIKIRRLISMRDESVMGVHNLRRRCDGLRESSTSVKKPENVPIYHRTVRQNGGVNGEIRYYN